MLYSLRSRLCIVVYKLHHSRGLNDLHILIINAQNVPAMEAIRQSVTERFAALSFCPRENSFDRDRSVAIGVLIDPTLRS